MKRKRIQRVHEVWIFLYANGHSSIWNDCDMYLGLKSKNLGVNFCKTEERY